MMNRVFEDQIGKNIEVYIDDMIVKSRHPRTISETWIKLSRS